MEKYAIVETGSKQYWVAPQHVIEVELLDVAEGKKEVILDQVMLVQDGGQVKVGTPVIAGAKVVCENLGEFRGPKLVHYRRSKSANHNFQRKTWHIQKVRAVQLTEETPIPNAWA
jgi:large subunit ribosomal protein L21